MNRQIQDDALYNDRFEEEEKKSVFKRYDYLFLFICFMIIFALGYYAHWSIHNTSQKAFMKQECIQFFESLSVR